MCIKLFKYSHRTEASTDELSKIYKTAIAESVFERCKPTSCRAYSAYTEYGIYAPNNITSMHTVLQMSPNASCSMYPYARFHRVSSQMKTFRYVYGIKLCELLLKHADRTLHQCYVLRDPHLRLESYTVQIIITICVNFLRFALFLRFEKCYVLRHYTFPKLPRHATAEHPPIDRHPAVPTHTHSANP